LPVVADPDEIVERARNGDKLAIARILTAIEDDPYGNSEILGTLWSRKPMSHVIGFTGAAGVGKSTLISAVALRLARDGRSIAIIAVDPSSPFSGGALLGDRIRMRRLTGKVFIRSMSTREEESLPWKALLAIEVLEGLGYEYIILETPGAGQFSVRVMKAVDTVVVVLMPGAGDEIQALKAGIMEIGDIYAINKADLPEAELTYSQVKFVLKDVNRMGWEPKVLLTSPIMGRGINDLINAINEHGKFAQNNNLLRAKRKTRRELELELLLIEALRRKVQQTLRTNGEAKKIYEQAIHGETDTVTATKHLLHAILQKSKETKQVR